MNETLHWASIILAACGGLGAVVLLVSFAVDPRAFMDALRGRERKPSPWRTCPPCGGSGGWPTLPCSLCRGHGRLLDPDVDAKLKDLERSLAEAKRRP